MKYKLICLDIDGTLLDNEKNLRPEVAEAVRRAASKGARIVHTSFQAWNLSKKNWEYPA